MPRFLLNRLFQTLVLLAGLAGGPAWAAGEEGEVEKWNSYVDLANDLEAVFQPALEAYLGTFGHEPDYRPLEGTGLIANYFLVMMEGTDNLELVLERAQAAADQGSEEELDRAVQEMLPYLQGLWTALNRSRDYHRERLARLSAEAEEQRELRARLDGPEDLHARIFTDYQGFAATSERFREALRQAGLERRRRDLKLMREEGLILRPAMLEILDAGQALQDFLNSRQITGVTLAGLKPGELMPFWERLEREGGLFEAARAAGSPRENLPAEALAEFSLRLGETLAVAAALAEAAPAEATPEALARAMGRMVDIYNGLE